MNTSKKVFVFGHELTFGISRYHRYELGFSVDSTDHVVGYKDFDTEKQAMDSIIPSGLDLMFKLHVKHINIYVTDRKTGVVTHRLLDFKVIATTQLVVSSPVNNR